MSAGWATVAVVCALIGPAKDCRTLTAPPLPTLAACQLARAATLATIAVLPGPIAFTADAKCVPVGHDDHEDPEAPAEKPGQPV